MPVSYQETLDYLYTSLDSLQGRPNKYFVPEANLQRVRHILAAAGNPHTRFPVVHIAGTKGKGSVAVICASVLRAAGYRVGLFTSPHLVDFCERVRVNDEYIPRETVVEIVDWLRTLAGDLPGLTMFEIVTALALIYFARQGVDCAVLEVGLGGRLDATNVVMPEVAVITSLSYDHTHLLGNTLAQIAAEKGGIIKPGVPVVSAPQAPEALDVLERLAAERRSPLTLIGRDWLFRRVAHSLDGQRLEVQPAGGPAQRLDLALLGEHQAENGAVAWAALSLLRERGWKIAPEAMAEGFRQVQWPGRFEILSRRPVLVADGAHNEDSARRLMVTLREHFPGRSTILIFGASCGKDVKGMFADLLSVESRVSRVILTEAGSPRAWEAHDLLALARAASPTCPMEVALPAAHALEKALELSSPEEVILVCGSLFLVADIRTAWQQRAGAV